METNTVFKHGIQRLLWNLSFKMGLLCGVKVLRKLCGGLCGGHMCICVQCMSLHVVYVGVLCVYMCVGICVCKYVCGLCEVCV